VRDGLLFARGAADDKTQILLQVAAAEAAIASTGLPLNLILLFEGEEEVGSPSLVPLLHSRRAELRADYVMIADSMMFAPRRPSLIFGMRGIACFEIETRTAAHDLHSGQYGGAVPNAGNALARILASLHHPDGRIALDAFYDDVAETAPSLRDEWRELGFDEEAYRKGAGGAVLSGEPGFSTTERLWTRPALDVNGILCGYTGAGKKTVLPCTALAKLSFRLVPDQDPERVAARLDAHLRRVTPKGVEVALRYLQGSRPWRENPGTPLFHAAATALEAVWGVPPVRVAHGGTLPIAPEIRDALGAPVMTMGFALPGANMHAPNEWIPLDHFERGARTMLRLYRELVELPK
jgi:acetylornithine deacetylase/succinyl-diaminopimelate desuccinylase-like protein